MARTGLEGLPEVCYGYQRFDLVTRGMEWLPEVWYGYHSFDLVTIQYSRFEITGLL